MSNYPPGVTGNEPQIVGYPDPETRDYASIERDRPTGTTWERIPWTTCPECDGTIVSPTTHRCPCGYDANCADCGGTGTSVEPFVMERWEAVCLDCGSIWTWRVDDDRAFLPIDEMPEAVADENARRILIEATDVTPDARFIALAEAAGLGCATDTTEETP